MKRIYAFFFLCLFLPLTQLVAQPHCDAASSELNMNSDPMLTYTFDEMSQYVAGVTQVGATQLTIRVDSIVGDSDCKWRLRAEVDNNFTGGGADVIDEWEPLNEYGISSLPTPTLDILQIRVKNACNTPMPIGFIPHFVVDGDDFWIINNFGMQNYDNCNSVNINTPGNPIENQYGAYTFIIDYRIRPEFNFHPGIYQISVKFYLEEDPN